VKWFYDAAYDYGAGIPGEPREIHGFVLRKPSEIRDHLVAAGIVRSRDFVSPVAVSEDEVRMVHDAELIAGLRSAAAIAAAIELPEASFLPAEVLWSAVVAPQLHAAGGTCEALAAAARGEWAINLSGGFHHARRNLSHGFCLVNDVALAVARLRRAGSMRPTLIVDLDLHQGDGNASLFAGDDEVFTLSLHEQEVFPVPKMRSDLDVGLRSGTSDAEYLDRLERALALAAERFAPEIVVYVAGTDPFEGDSLGSLRLTASGLMERDRRVARFAVEQRASLVALPAGGYSNESPSLAAAGFRAITETEPFD